MNYKLWPETLRLLRQERAAESEGRALLNANGDPLWTEVITGGGQVPEDRQCQKRLRSPAGQDEDRQAAQVVQEDLRDPAPRQREVLGAGGPVPGACTAGHGRQTLRAGATGVARPSNRVARAGVQFGRAPGLQPDLE